ncbi:hypothetical protein H5Q78_23780 [Escherichia coli]|nr:hypothetical protein [Escherichia coli]
MNEEDEARLSPLRHTHINMLGHYTFTLAEQVTKGHLRPLKQAEKRMNGLCDSHIVTVLNDRLFKKRT